jgi:hypothetical protein
MTYLFMVLFWNLLGWIEPHHEKSLELCLYLHDRCQRTTNTKITTSDFNIVSPSPITTTVNFEFV